MAERPGQADQTGEELAPSIPISESSDVDPVGDQPRPTQEVEDSECPCCQSVGVLTLPCGHKLCPTCTELIHGELGQAGCTICYGSQLLDSVLQALLEALFHGQPRRPGVGPGAVEESVGGGEDGGKAACGCSGLKEEELCVKHEEELCAFCLEEAEPLCRQCQADEHEDHQCCSVQEAVLDCKVRQYDDQPSLQTADLCVINLISGSKSHCFAD